MQNYSFGWKWIKHFTENENEVIIAFLKSQQQPLSASDAANNLQPKLQGRSVKQFGGSVSYADFINRHAFSFLDSSLLEGYGDLAIAL